MKKQLISSWFRLFRESPVPVRFEAAVGLVIATSNFGGTAAVTAVLAYGIFEIVGSLLLALAWPS